MGKTSKLTEKLGKIRSKEKIPDWIELGLLEHPARIYIAFSDKKREGEVVDLGVKYGLKRDNSKIRQFSDRSDKFYLRFKPRTDADYQ
jgi:hypothetical protein